MHQKCEIIYGAGLPNYSFITILDFTYLAPYIYRSSNFAIAMMVVADLFAPFFALVHGLFGRAITVERSIQKYVIQQNKANRFRATP